VNCFFNWQVDTVLDKQEVSQTEKNWWKKLVKQIGENI